MRRCLLLGLSKRIVSTASQPASIVDGGSKPSLWLAAQLKKKARVFVVGRIESNRPP
jgi:hypothetical protein